MNVVTDACSFIIMGKISVLRDFCNWKTVIATEGVAEEVLAGIEKSAADALIFSELVQNKLIKIEKVDGSELREKFGFGRGEAEPIALKLKDKTIATVLSDNRQGRKAASVLNLPLLGTLEVVVSMYRKKVISKDKALAAVNKAAEIGWFRPDLISECLNVIEND